MGKDIKSIEERIESLEKRLKEIDNLLEIVEKKRQDTIINGMLDGPIMMYGKHNIDLNTLNKKENPKSSSHGADETPPFVKTRKKKNK